MLIAFTLASLLQATPISTDPKDTCIACLDGHLYSVVFSPNNWGLQRMRVMDENGLVAEGAVTAYRNFSRFFLPSGPHAGFKFGIEANGRTLCTGDSGTNCAPCERAPEAHRTLLRSTNCIAETSQHRYDVYHAQWSDWKNELQVVNEHGEYVMGEAYLSGRHEYVVRLPYGPNEAFEKNIDQSTFCAGSECVPCLANDVYENTPRQQPPISTLFTCRKPAPNDNDTVSVRVRRNEIEFDVVYSDFGIARGQAIEVGPNRWFAPFPSFDLVFTRNGTTGQACTTYPGLPEACSPCTME